MPLIIGLLVIIVFLLGGGPILFAILMVPAASFATLISKIDFWIVFLFFSIVALSIVFAKISQGWNGHSKKASPAPANFTTNEFSVDRRRAMLAEAEVIGGNLYQHPSGIFLAAKPSGAIRYFTSEQGALRYAEKALGTGTQIWRDIQRTLAERGLPFSTNTEEQDRLFEQAQEIEEDIYRAGGKYLVISPEGTVLFFSQLTDARTYRGRT